MRKNTVNLFIMIILGLGFWMSTPKITFAANVYMPTEVKVYTYDKNNTDNRWKHFSTRTWTRNKYGLVTKMLDKSERATDKTTLKYTYKNNLLTGVKTTHQHNRKKAESWKDKYKYNKKNKVISHHSYNTKGKLDWKELYTYKGKKLIKKREYNKNTLANTRKYTWRKNKPVKYTVVYQGGVKGETVTYHYKSGKISYIVDTDPDNRHKDIHRYNSHGYPTKWDEVDIDDHNTEVAYTSTITEYKYNSKGRIRSVVTYLIDNEKKIPWIKNVYSGYKKYTIPKGDPMVNNVYIYYEYPEEIITSPIAK